MDKLELDLENIPRLLAFPLRVRHLGYGAVNFHNRKATFKSLDFSLELSGDSSGSVTVYEGKEHRAAFPCALLNLPGHYYETYTPRPWEVLYYTYDAAALPVVERLGMGKRAPVWGFQMTPRLTAAIAELFELAGRSHEYGAADKIDALCYEMMVETYVSGGAIAAAIELPRPDFPAEIRLRLRIPGAQPLTRATLNGRPHDDVDPRREFIRIVRPSARTLHITVGSSCPV